MVEKQQKCIGGSQNKMKQRRVGTVVRWYKENECVSDTVLCMDVNIDIGGMVWVLEWERDVCGNVINI